MPGRFRTVVWHPPCLGRACSQPWFIPGSCSFWFKLAKALFLKLVMASFSAYVTHRRRGRLRRPRVLLHHVACTPHSCAFRLRETPHLLSSTCRSSTSKLIISSSTLLFFCLPLHSLWLLVSSCAQLRCLGSGLVFVAIPAEFLIFPPFLASSFSIPP